MLQNQIQPYARANTIPYVYCSFTISTVVDTGMTVRKLQDRYTKWSDFTLLLKVFIQQMPA